MSANVTVMGVPTEGMGGLTESQRKFAKHHVEVGNALLNISGIGTATGGIVDKDEPRPPYQHQEYPKMVYHADGRDMIVYSEAELRRAEIHEFRTKPYPKVQVAVGDPAAEKKQLLDHNAKLQGQISTQQEALERLQKRLAALEGKGK